MNSGEKISVPLPQGQWKPAGMGVRLLATFIDGFIISVLSYPLTLMLQWSGGVNFQASATEPESVLFAQMVSITIWTAAVFFYYGYFYSQKGSSPGKMIFRLQVMKSETGLRLSWARAFIRESIGKTLSTMTLLFGYILGLLRQDRKTLHDFLVKSQVLQKVKN